MKAATTPAAVTCFFPVIREKKSQSESNQWHIQIMQQGHGKSYHQSDEVLVPPFSGVNQKWDLSSLNLEHNLQAY